MCINNLTELLLDSLLSELNIYIYIHRQILRVRLPSEFQMPTLCRESLKMFISASSASSASIYMSLFWGGAT